MATQRQTSTVTILFTDLVNSTELLEKAGDERAQRIFQAHHRLLKGAVAAHGGFEVKWLGDGLMVAFPSAASALRCAVAMQQGSRRPAGGERLKIRVGLNVGEPLRDESDYFGTPVVVAKRLCDRAEGGQILCSALVPGLLAGRRDFRFRECGDLELKGIAAPVAACEVLYEQARPESLLARTPFVGRAAELERLSERLQEAWAGSGGVVVLAGEPGIGKTRTAEEFAETARQEGATVLWGRCYEGEWTPPYEPFAKAIEEYSREADVDELRMALGSGAGLIARLVPTLRDRLPDILEQPPLQPEEERFRLLEAVSQFFVGVSARAPLLLALDDLHWAGAATIAMLRHFARTTSKSRILLLGTYRDTELVRQHPLADALGALPRETNYEHLPLKGLETTEVAQFLETLAEYEVPQAMVDAIDAETDGNPFFIREVLLHLIEGGKIFQRDGRWTSHVAPAEMGIPKGVRQVIGRRLSRLPQEANQALVHASLLGRNFEFDVLQKFTEMEEETLLAALESALEAQLIEEEKGQFGASYRFTHALVQETLYDQLSVARKQRLHLRAGLALEEARAGRLEPLADELARHFREGGDPEKAIEYSLRAGEAARAVFAYEEAAAHWQAALALVEAQGAEPERRAALLERLGGLMLDIGIDLEKGVQYLEEALKLYGESGGKVRAAQVQSRLGVHFSSFPPTADIQRALEHYRAAEAVLRQGPERASLGYFYMGLAFAAILAVRTEEGMGASRRAMEIGERLNDDAVWSTGAAAYGTLLYFAGKLADSHDLTQRAWETGDRLNHFSAFVAAWNLGLMKGYLRDPWEAARSLERELAKPRSAQAPNQRRALMSNLIWAYAGGGALAEARRAQAEAGPDPYPWAMVELVFWDGDWERAELLASQCREEQRRSGDRLDECRVANQLSRALRLRGGHMQAEEVLQGILAIALEGPHLPFEIEARTELALLYAETGQAEEAQPHLARCREVLAQGEDWRGLAGRVALAEGTVAALAGRVDQAEPHFERAIEVFRRYTLPWDEAEALRCWGGVLVRAGEREPGLSKLDGAIEIYRRHRAGQRWVELAESEKTPLREV